MSYCGNCGTQIQDGQDFCAGCGAAVRGDALAAQPVAPVQLSSSEVAGGPQSSEPIAEARCPQSAVAASSEKFRQEDSDGSACSFTGWAIVAVAGVVYFGYRVKQKASAALNNLESESGVHKVMGQAGSGDSSKSNSENNGGGSSGNDADSPLAAVLGKLQGADGGSSSPMGNMAKDIFEDVGVKNPEIPPDLVRNIPYSALTNPLPCPATTDQLIRRNWPAEESYSSPVPSSLTWSLPLADAESDNIIRSVSPASFIFEYLGVGATDIAMTTKIHPDFNQTVCAKDIMEGEAYATGWTFKSAKEPAPGLYPGVSYPSCPWREVQ